MKARKKDSNEEWNADKKELKKIATPIFNVHDVIIKKHNSDIKNSGQFTITDITGGKYWYNGRIICDINEQDEWELYEPISQKSAVVTEIERLLNENKVDIQCATDKHLEEYFEGYEDALVLFKEKFLDTIEVKEVELGKLIDDYTLPITAQDVKEEPFTQLEKCALVLNALKGE